MTPIKRARELYISAGIHIDEIKEVAGAIAEAVKEERERCAKVVLDFAKAYPKKVFTEPPKGKHGKTVDGCSARALRDILPGVAEKIREGEDPE